jgi:hypothetical protein
MDTEARAVLYEKPIQKEEAPVDGTVIHQNVYYNPIVVQE